MSTPLIFVFRGQSIKVLFGGQPWKRSWYQKYRYPCLYIIKYRLLVRQGQAFVANFYPARIAQKTFETFLKIPNLEEKNALNSQARQNNKSID